MTETPESGSQTKDFCEDFTPSRSSEKEEKGQRGHSGEYGNAANLAEKMSKSVMQLISNHF